MKPPQTIEQLYQILQHKKSNKQKQTYRFTTLLTLFNICIPPSQVIKIAGTNGKGSVAAMLEAMAIADNKTVVLFTSPHLYHITERFRINGQEIEPKLLNTIVQNISPKLLNIIQQKGEDMFPSFFEVLTIISLEIFKIYKGDLIILEAGIGGYNDVVHLIDGDLSAITSIGLDHTDKLGSTLSEIATDKVGIASKNSTLVLSSDIDDLAKNSILQDAKQRNIKIIQANQKNFRVELLGLKGYQITLDSLSLILPLVGAFQINNFVTAKTIFEQLIIHNIIDNFGSLQGVSNLYWPGRMEVIGHNPTWILDGAHNLDAMEKVFTEISNLLQEQQLFILLGLSDHNNPNDIIPYIDKLIKPITHSIYLTSGFYRSIKPENYRLLLSQKLYNITIFDHYESAMNNLFNHHQNRTNQLILIIGSLFLIGGCREYLLSKLR
ncbi:FolC bifunctional protein [Rippkaea orientalis PCC 8801]|uniref:tetrahydrofolate synthase n=1 Tax=Rippkaea orientalis (strain PCC 8801 / RF-1) TaxID=41431 RepID=B7JUV5_RIPO1|nr:cyanophycin synthetase [Rippkaea orientalis]ACK66807.1 FolC bifunctional protein [Rippkaea orientalis PCC 8801]